MCAGGGGMAAAVTNMKLHYTTAPGPLFFPSPLLPRGPVDWCRAGLDPALDWLRAVDDVSLITMVPLVEPGGGTGWFPMRNQGSENPE